LPVPELAAIFSIEIDPPHLDRSRRPCLLSARRPRHAGLVVFNFLDLDRSSRSLTPASSARLAPALLLPRCPARSRIDRIGQIGWPPARPGARSTLPEDRLLLLLGGCSEGLLAAPLQPQSRPLEIGRCPVPAPGPSRREETLLKIFFSRPICRELIDWLPILPIRPPLPSIGCSITLNWPD
jgi:hypothetical protein